MHILSAMIVIHYLYLVIGISVLRYTSSPHVLHVIARIVKDRLRNSDVQRQRTILFDMISVCSVLFRAATKVDLMCACSLRITVI